MSWLWLGGGKRGSRGTAFETRDRPKPKLRGRNQEPTRNEVLASGSWFWDFWPSWLLVWLLVLKNSYLPGWTKKWRPYYWSDQEVPGLTKNFLVGQDVLVFKYKLFVRKPTLLIKDDNVLIKLNVLSNWQLWLMWS